MIGGFLDDKFDLKPKFQIVFPILAVIVVIIATNLPMTILGYLAIKHGILTG